MRNDNKLCTFQSMYRCIIRWLYIVTTISVSSIIVSGCVTSSPKDIDVNLDLSPELTPAAPAYDANIGMFFGPVNQAYVHEQVFGNNLAKMDVGRASKDLFTNASILTFKKSKLVEQMPPYDVAVTKFDGIIEPRLDYVAWRMGFEEQRDYYHVEYTFIMYTKYGVPLSIWRVRGDGELIQDQMIDAAQKFVSGFSSVPETKIFRDYLAGKEVKPVRYDIDKINITTEVVDENPLGLELIASGIVPVKISVTNETGFDVMGRGYDARLIYSNERRLPPAFPLQVISATEQLVALERADPAAVGALLGPFGMLGSMFSSATGEAERKSQVEYFDKARLKEVVLKNGEMIEGKMFFVLPDDVLLLSDAKLSFCFIDQEANNGARKELVLSNINYKKLSDEELKLKAKEMSEKREALQPDLREDVNEEEF